MFSYAGGVAVVTGGAGGIGLAMAHAFAREGMKLVLADVDELGLARAAAAFEADGVEAVTLRVDVSDPAAVRALAELAYDRFGSVEILCNNAGVVPAGRARPVWEYPVEDWRWALDVNLMGVVNGLRSFVPRLIAQNRPAHIVNTASIAGLNSGSRSPVYSVTKHAVVRLTEALYASLVEAGYPIGVTLLCPGVVKTGIYHSERNRPAHLTPQGGLVVERPDLLNAADAGVDPAVVAAMVVEAVSRHQFYLLTTDAFDADIRARAEWILARRNPAFSDPWTVGERGKRD